MNPSTYIKSLTLTLFIPLLSCYGQEVDGGNAHTLILDEEGQVWTFGRNDHGQIGNGSFEEQQQPNVVQGLPTILRIARGYDHSLAVDEEGNVWAWGRNNYGQLGVEDFKDFTTPFRVTGLSGITAVEGGYWHSVGLHRDGTVWTWGHNYYGELGLGNREHEHHPHRVLMKTDGGIDTLRNIVSVRSVGYHTLALDSNGSIWGWGDNTSGQTGSPKHIYQTYARQVIDIPGMRTIATGWHHSIALDSNNRVWYWGIAKMENGKQMIRSPHRLDDLRGIEKIACGSWHSLAVDSMGRLWSWGGNKMGMLGNGDTNYSFEPVLVEGLDSVTEVGAGCFQSIAVDKKGKVWAFGDNYFGQLGIEDRSPQLSPQEVGINVRTGLTAKDIVPKENIRNASDGYDFSRMIRVGSFLLNGVLLFILGFIYFKWKRRRSIT